jgi:hypothetical protein
LGRGCQQSRRAFWQPRLTSGEHGQSERIGRELEEAAGAGGFDGEFPPRDEFGHPVAGEHIRGEFEFALLLPVREEDEKHPVSPLMPPRW